MNSHTKMAISTERAALVGAQALDSVQRNSLRLMVSYRPERCTRFEERHVGAVVTCKCTQTTHAHCHTLSCYIGITCCLSTCRPQAKSFNRHRAHSRPIVRQIAPLFISALAFPDKMSRQKPSHKVARLCETITVKTHQDHRGRIN